MTDDNDINNQENIIFDLSQTNLKQKAIIDKNGVDVKKLSNIERLIDNMSDTYYERAIDDINNLHISYNELINNLDNFQKRLKVVYDISHDMKGQGASFNYHMVTYIGDYLCRFIERIQSKPTQKILDIIQIHINSMNIILVQKIKGKSDPMGDEILNGLEATLQKYAPDIVEVLHSFRKQQEEQEAK